VRTWSAWSTCFLRTVYNGCCFQSAYVGFRETARADEGGSSYRTPPNFKRDHLIPLNSPVEIVHSSKAVIFFIYQDKMIALQNIRKYTRIDTEELLKRTFRDEKVDLSMYASERRAEIEQGKVVEGMRKAAVLLAHTTPDLDADDWRYWHGRANSRTYHFKDGKYTGYTD
jgi:hypothetical protein